MAQDTLDAHEYALGPAASKWGALRAANGHPDPFSIKYVQIGNENSGDRYHRNARVLAVIHGNRQPLEFFEAT